MGGAVPGLKVPALPFLPLEREVRALSLYHLQHTHCLTWLERREKREREALPNNSL